MKNDKSQPRLTARLSLLMKNLSSPENDAADRPAALLPPPDAQKSRGADCARDAEPPAALPDAEVLNPSHDAWRDMRKPRWAEVDSVFADLKSMQCELSSQGRFAEDYADLPGWIQHAKQTLELMRERMEAEFLPPHGQSQLIGPRLFFMSPIFAVRSRGSERQEEVVLTLDSTKHGDIVYSGPELRQGDGLVFKALLNVCRDLRVGKQAAFDVADLCLALWGRYNGEQRKRLRESIRRLQKATVQAPSFTVQLVQRFDHPKQGRWSVMLDSDIVQVFQGHQFVWLDSEMRRRLPEGLTTWLYCYIRTHLKLIPWSIEDLRTRCGSDAQPKPFRASLKAALKCLADNCIIDEGWFIRENRVHWRKYTGGSSTDARAPDGSREFSEKGKGRASDAAVCISQTPPQRQLDLPLN